MKYTRKRFSRKPTKRSYRKRAMNISRPRAPRPKTNALSFKRTWYGGTWTPNSSTTTGFMQQMNYQFNTMPFVAEYVNLFDEYKINAIKLVFRPRYDGFNGNDTTDTVLPGVTNQGATRVHVCSDLYGNYTPAGAYTNGTFNNFFEQGNVKSYSGNRAISLYWKPTVLEYANPNSSQKKIRSKWYPVIEPGVQHFGPTVFMQDVNLTGTFGQAFDMFITFYGQVRGAR